MSPRRSSRARTTAPAPAHTASSNSSNSQNRIERSTRSHNKRETSSTQRSESREDSTTGQADPLATRRSKRGLDADNEDVVNPPADDEDEEEVEAEEVTRCICGFAEYPGPPVDSYNQAHKGSKAGIKDENGTQPAITSEIIAEDAGNFFIQCDNCQVWQHGGCVGLMDEAMSPDEYFCEQCKPLLHKIIRGANGTRTTRYLPVLEAKSSRSSSISSSESTTTKDAKQRARDATTRRRATMNSRDAAYDEEEMMRRAIEESKMSAGSLGKRSRDESEDKQGNSKRLRTSSGSPNSNRSASHSQPLSDDEDDSKPSINGSLRKHRGAVARTSREKETREKQKEVDRQKKEEAAGRRAARSERRRGEDTPPPTPSLSPSKQEAKTIAPPPQKTTVPDTPSSHRPTSSNHHRKTGRPPARRGRMRNQYTRDTMLNGDHSPLRDTSLDGQGSPHATNHITNGESGRTSRPKYFNPNRTSLNEMKRRVAGIVEFVSRLQTEHGSSSSEGSTSTPNGTAINGAGAVTTNSLLKGVEAGLAAQSRGGTDKRTFRDMDSKDMMEELMKGAIYWQSSYGKYGEK